MGRGKVKSERGGRNGAEKSAGKSFRDLVQWLPCFTIYVDFKCFFSFEFTGSRSRDELGGVVGSNHPRSFQFLEKGKIGLQVESSVQILNPFPCSFSGFLGSVRRDTIGALEAEGNVL